MTNLEKIYYALNETYLANKKGNAMEVTTHLIEHFMDGNYKYFTRENGAREHASDVAPNDFIEEMIKFAAGYEEYVKVIDSSVFSQEGMSTCQRVLNMPVEEQFNYLKNSPKELAALMHFFTYVAFESEIDINKIEECIKNAKFKIVDQFKEVPAIRKIDYIITETKKYYPRVDLGKLLGQNVQRLMFDYSIFTRKNDARLLATMLKKEDYILEIAKNALKIASIVKEKPTMDTPYISCFRELAAVEGNMYLYLISHKELLGKLAEGFVHYRYDAPQKVVESIDIYEDKTYLELSRKLEQDYLEVRDYEELDIRSKAFNQCRKDVLNGVQLVSRRTEYSLEDVMYATSDVGRNRNNQEDSVLLITHPDNKYFRMMVVADGVGGSEEGELASRIVVEKIMKWFENLDPCYYMMEHELETLFNVEVSQIGSELALEGMKGSTTFCGAIIGETNTIIANVGDSRAYVVSDLELQQVTEDDSLCTLLLHEGKIANKEDARFHINNNMIFQSIGSGYYQPNIITIPNDSYDTLLLFSDGVTDCLSDSQIMAICKKTSREQLATVLVESALRHNSPKPKHLSSEEYQGVRGGKDNTTAVVFDNQEGKRIR